MSIIIRNKNDFSKTEKMLNDLHDFMQNVNLEQCGRLGVEALEEATPKDTGETARSWSYSISYDGKKKEWKIIWSNSKKTKQGDCIALLIQYGHATNFGGYVKGRDYINPALQPIFDRISELAWREVNKT